MPNHITNKVLVERQEKFAEIEALMKSAESRFDFNCILPMPEELRGTSSPASIVSEEDYKRLMDERAEKEARGESVGFMGRPITEKMSREFIKKYGVDNWYDWAILHWGTKWNAYEVEVDEDSIRFQTAWSTPLPVMSAISRKFPDVDIRVEYADEDIGSNCGWYILRNGKIIDEGEGDRVFALTAWGRSEQKYKVTLEVEVMAEGEDDAKWWLLDTVTWPDRVDTDSVEVKKVEAI